jgi:hypothetical protein
MEQEVQGTFSYSLIAVHEVAGDECAHAQLIADTIRLRYRDTSLATSSETNLSSSEDGVIGGSLA